MSNLENQDIAKCTQCPDECLLTDLKCGKGRRFLERVQNGGAEDQEHQDPCSRHRHNGEDGHTGYDHGDHHKHGRHRNHGHDGHHKHGRHSMNMEDRDELSGLLGRCGHHLYHQNNKKRGQGRILKILAQSGEMTQKDLQDHLEIKSGSMSEIISKLEAKGMVTREKDETDKRKIILKITQTGREKAKRHLNEEKSKPLYGFLSEEEQETLKTLLKKVLDNWHMKRQ